MSDLGMFKGLNHLIQYRRKHDGVRWIAMAAFDAVLPAERYFEKQRNDDEDWPWEYRLMDLSE